MSAPGVVVADTTPLNYLILIGRTEILGRIFGEVLVPQAVMEELRHPKAPPEVVRWLRETPPWLTVVPVRQLDVTIQLGKGENEAISLAIERSARIVLMDERLGRAAAQARGLLPIGTLNLIDLADEMRLLDSLSALHDLARTNFRADQELLGRFESRIRERRL